MNCARCGQPTTPGNSRKNGKRGRVHKTCPKVEAVEARLKKAVQTRLLAPKSSEPGAAAPSEPQQARENSHRLFIRPAVLERVQQKASGSIIVSKPHSIEIYVMPNDMLDAWPDLVEGLVELRVKSG